VEVTARKYIIDREPDLQDRTGIVIDGADVPQGTEVPKNRPLAVRWNGPGGAVRFYAASNLKLARTAQPPVAGPLVDGGNGSSDAERLASVERALNPDAGSIADEDVAALRGQSLRQRLIAHLLDPGDGHDHGLLEISEGAARRRSEHDLVTYHGNAHGGRPHEL